MKSCKTFFGAIIAALTIVTAGNALANPRAAEASGSDFLVAADDLGGWHVGGFYRYQSRELGNGVRDLSQDNFAFHVGRDILPWISVYGFVGTSDIETQQPGIKSENDVSAQYGAGLWLNLIDQDIFSRLTCETRLRLQACAQISAGNPDVNGKDMHYTDFYANATVGIMNELIGNKLYFPESIGIFFGPCYSDLSCDDLKTTGDNLGLIFGLDVIVSRTVGFSASYETYGSDDAVNFSLNIRF